MAMEPNTFTPRNLLQNHLAWCFLAVMILAASFTTHSGQARAQTEVTDPLTLAEAALATEEPTDATSADSLDASAMPNRVNLLELLSKGGYLMLPIALMSLLVVTFGMERMLGLRRRKVIPPKLIRAITGLTESTEEIDLHEAYRLCQQYPSAAGRVLRAMLLKVGRPHSEVERAVAEASDREAARLYSNVRWLSLAAGVTPLLGLLGTVWGMIQAFFATANLPVGANKADYLAQGIYVALVTTFAGLAVAIPAAVLAHYFEGCIQRHFRNLEETLSDLLPQLEPFEGRIRVNHGRVEDPESITGRPK